MRRALIEENEYISGADFLYFLYAPAFDMS